MLEVLDLFLLLFTWILCCGNMVFRKPLQSSSVKLSNYTVMFCFIRFKCSFPTVLYCISASCLHKNDVYIPLITLNFQIQTISIGHISSSVLPASGVLIMFFEFFCNSCFFEGLGAPGSATAISDGINQKRPGTTECTCELWSDVSRRLFCRLYHSTRRLGKKIKLNFHVLFKAYF